MKFEIKGDDELIRAIQRNPQKTREEVGKFLPRVIAIYNRSIIRNPWKMGMSGGGSPADTRNMIDQHHREIKQMEARIYVDESVNYRWYVHEGTMRMKERPWLNYAMDSNKSEVKQLQGELLKELVKDLAK